MQLMKYIRVNRTAPVFTLLFQAFFFVIGLGMVLVINAFLNEDPDYACMGSLLALVAIPVGVLTRGNLGGHVRFRIAVSMGSTRRSYLLCDPIVSALTAAIGILIARLLYLAESSLLKAVYPGFENDLPLDAVFSWQIVLILIAAMVVLDLAMSALMQRLGAKGPLVISLCLCSASLILPRAVDAYQEGGDSLFARLGRLLVDAVTSLSAAGWIAIGIAFALALVIFSVETFRKAEAAL